MSGRSNVTPIDPEDFVRRHQERFFSAGEFNAWEAIGQIVTGALILGSRQVEVARLGSWWAVGSTEDWLSTARPETVFASLAPFPESGPNSFHSEFLLSVFASSVMTVGGENVFLVKGENDDDVIKWARTGGRLRTVAFEP